MVASASPLLKAITAFANTNDGAIFFGVSDAGEVVGLDPAMWRDTFVTDLQNAVRDRIRPSPVLDVSFEEAGTQVVARIFVPRESGLIGSASRRRPTLFDFIEGWHNARCRHLALDYRSPVSFEQAQSIDDRTVPVESTIDHGGPIWVSPR